MRWSKCRQLSLVTPEKPELPDVDGSKNLFPDFGTVPDNAIDVPTQPPISAPIQCQRPQQKQIFVGKLNRELRASKKERLASRRCEGILGRSGIYGFWAAEFLRDPCNPSLRMMTFL
jgi:hypothetical protein